MRACGLLILIPALVSEPAIPALIKPLLKPIGGNMPLVHAGTATLDALIAAATPSATALDKSPPFACSPFSFIFSLCYFKNFTR